MNKLEKLFRLADQSSLKIAIIKTNTSAWRADVIAREIGAKLVSNGEYRFDSGSVIVLTSYIDRLRGTQWDIVCLDSGTLSGNSYSLDFARAVTSHPSSLGAIIML